VIIGRMQPFAAARIAAVPPAGSGARGPRLVHALERGLDRAFGREANPLRQLGAIGFWLFWIVAASGTYLYVFFDTSVDGAWRSLDALGRDQPWAGGLLRSLHRYASDAFVAVAVLHLLREWLLGRHGGFRWFTWVSGVPLLGLALASGVVGFWLAWDALGAWVAGAALEWLSVLPGLGARLVRNAVVEENVTDRMFSLLVFLHIGLSLLVLLAMWVHVQRLARAVTRPHRRVALGVLVALALLAALRPAPLHAPADLARAGGPLAVDWLYLAVLPAGSDAPLATWVAVGALGLVLLGLPWWRARPRAPAARVDPANCNGCGRCFDDCPYGAVVMAPRTDGRPHRVQAQVDADLCAGCGICAGACPSSTPFRSVGVLASGIDLPGRDVQRLRERAADALHALAGPRRVLVFACECGADADGLAGPEVATVPLACAGQLAPAFVEHALRHGADAVVVAGCSTEGCAYRLGARWTLDRLRGAREPRLRASVEAQRIARVGADPGEEAALAAGVARFVATVPVPDAAGARRRLVPGAGPPGPTPHG
jgi:ferredoxin/coenzyme F420-reducing hydrogenase delta subunit